MLGRLKLMFSSIKTWEFGKKLLAIDYLTFLMLIICKIKFPNMDFDVIICTYIGQLTIATGAYYWKAKCENRIKVPMKVIKSLPKDIREQVDLTTIITAIIQSE